MYVCVCEYLYVVNYKASWWGRFLQSEKILIPKETQLSKVNFKTDHDWPLTLTNVYCHHLHQVSKVNTVNLYPANKLCYFDLETNNQSSSDHIIRGPFRECLRIWFPGSGGLPHLHCDDFAQYWKSELRSAVTTLRHVTVVQCRAAGAWTDGCLSQWVCHCNNFH